jgi:hypothetical protein
MQLFLNLLESAGKKNIDIWESSDFKKLKNLSADERGYWGEECMFNLLSFFFPSEKIIWDSNKNTNHSDGSIFDILFCSVRIEVKTAMMGINSSWQHENIKQERLWDIILFFDIAPNGSYLTIMNYSEIPFGKSKNKILNKKSTEHLGGWKFDFSRNTINLGLKNDLTFFIDSKNPDTEGLKIFLEKKLLVRKSITN